VYYDQTSHRVFVAHGSRVDVIDGRDGGKLGAVEGMAGGTHGIAISSATGKGYTDDGAGGQAVAFDLKTLKVTTKIGAQPDADAVILDNQSGHVFVMDGDAAKIGVIDPKTDKVVATIPGGGKLEYAASDENGHVYVNGEDKREIIRVNTKTNTVDARWPIPTCDKPHGLAVDTATHRLFSGCVNSQIVVVNADTGAVVASLPIGKGSDAVMFDAKRKLVLSSNGADGTLSVIQQKDADTYVPLEPVKTAVSGRTMALDPDSGRLYIAAAEVEPNTAAGGRPKPRPGTLQLIFLDPAR
jgi:YVTN family beta-propeller protein